MAFPDGYNCDLPMGEDNADNAQDTSLVTANADGSVLERLEYLQVQVAALASGEVMIKGIVDTAAPSTTNVKCAGLAGFGNAFFHNNFYMQVLRSGGAAPEPEIRLITDYVSSTGTFTCSAFSQNVESGDLILIMHESAIAVGRNDSNNTFDSSSVAANADGSILERLEAMKDQIDAVDNYVDGEITLIKTETDKIPATIVKIDAEIVKTTAIKAKTDILPSNLTKTVTFANTAAATLDLFNITGTVDIELCAVVRTNVESAGGCNIQVDCGALAVIAVSDCTTLEAPEIWFANTPTTSVVALVPYAASFALSPVKKFRVTNGQDITLTIEAAKQVDSGVIDFYVKWSAVSSDGAVVAAA